MQNVKIHVFSWNVTEHVRYDIRLRYIRIGIPTSGIQDTLHPSGYTQDLILRIHQDTYPIGNYPQNDRKCTLSRAGDAQLARAFLLGDP